MEGYPDPKKAKKAKPTITYPWTLDPEVLSTQKSLPDVEAKLGKKLGKDAW